jgi:cytochrome b
VKTSEQPRASIAVWDWLVRVGHWLLAGSFATAYFSAESESWRLVHVISGISVGAIVAFRIVWGFVGPAHARFSDFIKPPSHAFHYLKQLLTRQPEHHTGHNPAGGWAVVFLLGLCAACALSGWLIYNDKGGRWAEQAHEWLANIAIGLVAVHVAAVVFSSIAHKENLVLAMLTGRKLGQSNEAIPVRSGRLAVILLLVWIFISAWWLK